MQIHCPLTLAFQPAIQQCRDACKGHGWLSSLLSVKHESDRQSWCLWEHQTFSCRPIVPYLVSSYQKRLYVCVYVASNSTPNKLCGLGYLVCKDPRPVHGVLHGTSRTGTAEMHTTNTAPMWCCHATATNQSGYMKLMRVCESRY